MPRPALSVRSRGAFTLIELLVVIALLAGLMLVGVNVSAGARETAARHRARTELAVLSQALERFRAHFGDYPRTTQPALLLSALVGTRGVESALSQPGRRFLETHGFSLSDPAGAEGLRELLDPWDHAYAYRHAPGDGVNPPGYRLYSIGPDGAPGLDASGDPDPGAVAAADNVYAQR